MVVVYSLRNRNYLTAIMRVASLGQLLSLLKIVSFLHTLEILTLVAYLITMKVTLGVSGVKQLAFVVATQRRLLQPNVVTAPVVVFAMAVVHDGNDFTFQFEWLKHRK